MAQGRIKGVPQGAKLARAIRSKHRAFKKTTKTRSKVTKKIRKSIDHKLTAAINNRVTEQVAAKAVSAGVHFRTIKSVAGRMRSRQPPKRGTKTEAVKTKAGAGGAKGSDSMKAISKRVIANFGKKRVPSAAAAAAAASSAAS